GDRARAAAQSRHVYGAAARSRRALALIRDRRAREPRLRRDADALGAGQIVDARDCRCRELPRFVASGGGAMKAVVAIAVLLASGAASAQVTFERILEAQREPHNWLSYSATLDNQRHSLLDQIDTT